MTSSHPAILNRRRTGVAAASIGAGLGLAALALGITIARADNSGDEQHSTNANVERAAQLPPPARVILPAPWEQAPPAQPAAAPVKSEVRK